MTSLIALSSAVSRAATYSVIHRFDVSTIGPIYGDFVADAQGRLYGPGAGQLDTLSYVFRLTPPEGGKQAWSASIVADTTGFFIGGDQTLGGVTLVNDSIFGLNAAGEQTDDGAVFRIDPGGVVSTLHDFLGIQVKPADGSQPVAGMIQGPSKLLYGTTMSGGSKLEEAGVVFSVSPSASKPSYRVLHRFGAAGDGALPGTGRLALDSQGRLFGVTLTGGNGFGTIFVMQRVTGRWTEQVVYGFGVNDLYSRPRTNVVLDGAGNLYACSQGSSLGKGGVYRIAPPTQDGGTWTYSVLYSFGQAADEPNANSGCAVTIDQATGKLFGTTYGGGARGFGTVWELDPPVTQGAPWTDSVIHSFDGSTGDGRNPVAAPYRLGNSYYGGNLGGVVYQFTP